MAYIENLECCGIKEIVEIGETFQRYENISIVIKNVCDKRYSETTKGHSAFYVFSDIIDADDDDWKMNAGIALKKYISSKNLGTTIETTKKVNPNSGNTLKVWIWTVNNKNLLAWYKKNYPTDYSKMGEGDDDDDDY